MALKILCFIQGCFYIGTGIWPLLSIRTFMKVTGPKTDLWLVKTVGVLISVIGFVLTVAALKNRINFEIFLLAIGPALALSGIDIYYTLKRTISPVYLLDAAVEIMLIAFWLLLF